MRELQAIQADINMMDQAIQNAGMGVDTSSWLSEKEKYEREFVEATAYWADQERAQAQAEIVESITLPLDFNDLFGNPLANETIVEVVKQFRLQAYEEHNAEVARINAENKSNLETLYARHNEVTEQFINDKNDLQRRLDAENEQAKLDAIELGDLTEKVAQLGLEKQDAEYTRDNAVRISEESTRAAELLTKENAELREQIEALKQELTAKKALTVGSNDKLAELAAKAKESTAAAAQRGIDRWNQQYGMDIPVLEVPEVQPVNAVLETVEASGIQPFPEKEVQATDDTGIPTDVRDAAQDTVVGPNEESEVVTRAEFNELKGRVDTLFSNQYIGQKEVA